MLIDDHLYFRKIDNPADSLTLYKTPYHKSLLSEIPLLDEKVETVFSLNDLIAFYKNYAVYDERIKAFCEKITEMVKTGDHG